MDGAANVSTDLGSAATSPPDWDSADFRSCGLGLGRGGEVAAVDRAVMRVWRGVPEAKKKSDERKGLKAMQFAAGFGRFHGRVGCG
jgi:hypothetical protein